MQTADHAALLDEIAKAKEAVDVAFHAMWHAGQVGTNEEHAEKLAAWQKANQRYMTLNEAGLILTLGPVGDD